MVLTSEFVLCFKIHEIQPVNMMLGILFLKAILKLCDRNSVNAENNNFYIFLKLKGRIILNKIKNIKKKNGTCHIINSIQFLKN